MGGQDNKNYEEFFEQIKKFKNEQAKQKQRGLNDYNILTAVRKPHAEVGMHSNFIYSLINPDGLHYQDDLFVNLFIKEVLKIDDFGKVTKVEMEEDANGRRIDFTIKSDKYYIGIEMKIYASDQYEQIKDYFENLKEKSQQKEIVLIYYLTLDGKDASKDSSKGVEYKKISFETEILDWLEKCQYEVQNITNLNEAIKQYKSVVEMVTNKYQGKVMNLADELLKNEKWFELAKEISQAYEEANIKKVLDIKNNYLIKIKHLLNTLPYEELDWKALDIKSKYFIRIIPQEELCVIQITDIKNPFNTVDGELKIKVLEQLKKIDMNFKSGWNKVYGILEIKYDNINEISNIMQKLTRLNNDII